MLKRTHLVQIPGQSSLITAHVHVALTRYLCPNRKMHRSFLPSDTPLSLPAFSVLPRHFCLPAVAILLYCTAFPGSLCSFPVHILPSDPSPTSPHPSRSSPPSSPAPSRDNYNKSCEDGLVFKQLNKHVPGAADGPGSTTLREKMRRGKQPGGDREEV